MPYLGSPESILVKQPLSGVRTTNPAREPIRFGAHRRNGRVRRNSKIDADVVSRYERGESTRVIAAALGMGKATVLDILNSANVVLRPVGRHS